MIQELAANAVCYASDSGKQQGNRYGADDRKVEELLNEIACECSQPAGAVIGLEDVIPVKEEQGQLLAANQMVGVCKLEKAVSRQKCKYCGQAVDVAIIEFHIHQRSY